MSAPSATVTLPMYTTITVNGLGGERLLSVLAAKLRGHLGPALAPLIDGSVDSLEIETDLAEQVADLIERLIDDDLIDDDGEPPLLFSPNVGDSIAIVRD